MLIKIKTDEHFSQRFSLSISPVFFVIISFSEKLQTENDKLKREGERGGGREGEREKLKEIKKERERNRHREKEMFFISNVRI